MKIAYLADHEELVPILASWAFSTWGCYNPSYTLEKRIESFNQHRQKDQIPLALVALSDDGTPMGMASLRPNDGIRDDLTPWLGSVFVEPRFRNRGIAASLVREIHRVSSELGFETIYLLTYEPTLPAWYARLGWDDFGEDACHGNQVNVMRLEHRKRQPATD